MDQAAGSQDGMVQSESSYIESMNEPAKPEMVPVEEPVSDLHSTEEPATDKDTPIREPYRQQQEPMKMRTR